MIDYQEYSAKLLSRIGKCSEKTSDREDVKHIHQLRVAIKKMKAFSCLINWYTQDFDKGKMNAIWKLGGKAGDLREWQLLNVRMQQSFLPHNFNSEILNLIKQEEKNAYRYFCRKQDKCTGTELKKVRRYLKPFAISLRKINPVDYLNNAAENLELKLSRTNLSNEMYHAIRTDVKKLMYNSEIFSIEIHDLKRFVLLPGFLNTADTLLGEWHDAVVAGRQLQQLSATPGVSAPVRNGMLQLEAVANTEAERWLLKFKHDINQFHK
ncbi:MAG: CHAD domain-containing protein [Chitinophagales bacterium]